MYTRNSINQDYLTTIHRVINNAIAEHPRTMLVMVILRMPYSRFDDVPHSFEYSQRDKLLSRFIDSLKAKVRAHVKRVRRSDKRCHDTNLRYFWVREIGRENQHVHYHVGLMVNKDTFNSLGRYHSERNNLGSYIAEAWLSGLGLSVNDIADMREYETLVHFSDHPLYYLDCNSAGYGDVWREMSKRLEYYAKDYSKDYNRHMRSIGCSQR
ncbi:inovirus-type Gp2 protein [Citrobacter werkmanii]|uniref:inovirus Gp2 family protein n=1 Tax=Citrobacter werkmanii TaxID=67827 RepID=UPI0013781FAC|nr:inovirus Gp2 family protein [Citrobacter werkmanii]NBD83338.1 inovirus-type Gp2 protein [Citrobacter werkmanii]HCB1597117.1 inovirus Gp2 family protein [Citrobacter farmeri]